MVPQHSAWEDQPTAADLEVELATARERLAWAIPLFLTEQDRGRLGALARHVAAISRDVEGVTWLLSE